MKKVVRVLLAALLVGCVAVAANADVKPAAIFTSHMVLQRDADVPVWGWANAGESVTVTFADQTLTTKTDDSGKWMVTLRPMPMNTTGQKMVIKGNNEVTLENILIGEVWICSGQSNMQYTMSGLRPVTQPDIDSAEFPLIRFAVVPCMHSPQPQKDCRINGNVWNVSTPQTVPSASATGFFFGRELFKMLNVPVGLVMTSWGGTRIEPWTPPVGFNAVAELDKEAKRVNSWDSTTEDGKAEYAKAIEAMKAWIPMAEKQLAAGERVDEQPQVPHSREDHQDSTRIYNSMIHPLIPMAFAGAIWYQGESNGGEGVTYLHKLKALIGGWRTLWNKEFPFGIVQLANYQAPSDIPGLGNGYARVREAELQALDAIPNTGLAVIIDIGEARDIHPKNKYDVGLRLALWAMAKHYGQKDLVYSGPIYKEAVVEGNKIRIKFDNIGSGMMVGKKNGLKLAVEDKGAKLKRFAIAGEDKKFVWADAVIDGDSVVVSSKEVEKPVAVRYAFSMNPEGCNLYNKEGLPASPFRTDSW